MEPAWTKPISNTTVCGFYYILFWLRAVIAGLVLVTLGFTLTKKNKLPAAIFYPVLLIQITMLALAVTDSLFTYLVCQRSLIEKPKQKVE